MIAPSGMTAGRLTHGIRDLLGGVSIIASIIGMIAVAEILRNRVRETDTVARLGGDEFAILMMGTDLDEVEAKLALLAGDLNTRTLHWDGIEIPILASVGSEALDPALGVEAALDQADHAMYATKKTRNGQFAGR